MSVSLCTTRLLGLPYANISPDALRGVLYTQLAHGQRPLCIYTPNLTIAAAAAQDASLHALLQSGDLLLPDGHGVLLASRLAGCPIRHRLPGIEAGESVLEICATLRLPVFFLGAAPGIARKAAANQKCLHPNLPIAGTHHGFFQKEDLPALLQEIRDSGARVVLVCLGFPAQERWIAEHAQKLPHVRLLMGLGGSFDVWAGNVRRAPAPIRAVKLEWLWRIAQKPSRLKALLPAACYLRAAKRSAKGQKPVKI